MELSPKQLRLLLRVKNPSDINTMRLVSEFSDDRIPCATAMINRVQIDLWYCGGRTIGALECDGDKAKKIVFEAMQSELHMTVNSMFDRSDEELAEEVASNRKLYQEMLDHLNSLRKNNSLRTEIEGYFDGAIPTIEQLETVAA